MSEVAPHNMEAEQELLGSLLLNNEAMDRVEGLLGADDFFEPLHGRIFSLITAALEAGRKATPVTLRTALERDGALGDMGGMKYLATLAGAATTVVNLRDYALVIRHLAERRAMMRIGHTLMQAGQAPPDDMDDPLTGLPALRHALAEELSDVGQHAALKAGHTAAEACAVTLELIEKRQRDGFSMTGVATGIAGFDRMTGGMPFNTLSIIAARPSMGKSTMGLQAAIGAAKAGHGVYFSSLEMDYSDLWARALAAETVGDGEGDPVIYADALRGQISPQDIARLRAAETRLRDLPIKIDDRPQLTLGEIVQGARRYGRELKKQGRTLDMLVVDHIGHVRPAQKYQGQRRLELGEITAGLLGFAKQQGLAAVALCQLNRALESRTDKRPTMADLRESGQIEEDAHLVALIHRPEYYVGQREPNINNSGAYADWEDEMRQVRGRANIIIAKQRNGPTGPVHVGCKIKSAWFGDQANYDGEGL